MKRSARLRKTATLADSVQQHLNMYVLAASAAGAGMLASAQPVEAKIIYTHAHKNLGPITFLDLNHDGVHDFKLINNHIVHSSGSMSANLAVYGVSPANRISGQSVLASALPPAAYIGPNGKFQGKEMAHLFSFHTSLGSTETGHSGFWAGPTGRGIKHRYLGLKFSIAGKIHFGWARLDVLLSAGATIQATLTGYAYETIPGKSIIAGATEGAADERGKEDSGSGAAALTSPIPDAPQPASLGALALGAQGVPLWRRRESSAAMAEND